MQPYTNQIKIRNTILRPLKEALKDRKTLSITYDVKTITSTQVKIDFYIWTDTPILSIRLDTTETLDENVAKQIVEQLADLLHFMECNVYDLVQEEIVYLEFLLTCQGNTLIHEGELDKIPWDLAQDRLVMIESTGAERWQVTLTEQGEKALKYLEEAKL